MRINKVMQSFLYAAFIAVVFAVTSCESADSTANEATEVASTNKSDETSFETSQQTGPVKITEAKMTAANKIEVTFDREIVHFVPEDLKLRPSKGLYLVQLDLSRSMEIENISSHLNDQGQTVAVLTLTQELNPDATVRHFDERTEIPLLTANYYSGVLERDVQQADALLTWQLESGGWSKNMESNFKNPWDGKAPRSEYRVTRNGETVYLSTIDNDATINEMLFLAKMYRETEEERYKEAVHKAVNMLLDMQYPSGGWPQVYPKRGNYSDMVTFNDGAMIRAMTALRLAANKSYPFDSDLLTSDQITAIKQSLEKGIDYILKSQIVVDGKLTAWCQQHDPVTYEPVWARAYEMPSLSASESVAIVQYLMSEKNPSKEIEKAVIAALEWFEEAAVEDTRFEPRDPKNQYFYESEGSRIWYRFYEIGTNKPLFLGRDSVPHHDITKIEEERRHGYSWAGTWPEQAFIALKTNGGPTGYYMNRVYIQVLGSESETKDGNRIANQLVPVTSS